MVSVAILAVWSLPRMVSLSLLVWSTLSMLSGLSSPVELDLCHDCSVGGLRFSVCVEPDCTLP